LSVDKLAVWRADWWGSGSVDYLDDWLVKKLVGRLVEQWVDKTAGTMVEWMASAMEWMRGN
jgi:hypothetical protein